MEIHRKTCRHKEFHCPIWVYAGEPDELLEHIKNKHISAILEKLAIKTEEVKEKNPEVTPGQNPVIGATGKYYCGKPLINNCSCCLDFRCGEIDGCNCIDCMKLDIAKRRLRGWMLVNKLGQICRVFRNGEVFWGAGVIMQVDENYRGGCGFDTGIQCSACKVIKS